MLPYAENIVTYGHLLAGYDRACARLWTPEVALDPNEPFYALFEALNWAVALDERAAAHWAPEGEPLGWRWRERFDGGRLVRGVRFARNTVHHQWGDAVVVREAVEIGAAELAVRPDAFGSPRPRIESLALAWRPLEELPRRPRADAEGEDAYRLHLAERPVALTLHELQSVFWKLWHFLERPRMFPDPDGAPGGTELARS